MSSRYNLFDFSLNKTTLENLLRDIYSWDEYTWKFDQETLEQNADRMLAVHAGPGHEYLFWTEAQFFIDVFTKPVWNDHMKEINASELLKLMDAMLLKVVPSYLWGDCTHISWSDAETAVNLFDQDYSGGLNEDELVNFWQYLGADFDPYRDLSALEASGPTLFGGLDANGLKDHLLEKYDGLDTPEEKERCVRLLSNVYLPKDELEARVVTLDSYLADDNHLKPDVIAELLFGDYFTESGEGIHEGQLLTPDLNTALTVLGFNRQWEPVQQAMVEYDIDGEEGLNWVETQLML